MIPLKVRVVADALFVITRVALPSATVPENIPAPVPAKAKSPPIVTLFAKVLDPLTLMVPPLIVRGQVLPPNELLPATITVPALRVKLLVLGNVLPCAPMFHVPLPDLVRIADEAVVDQLWPVQVKVAPSPTLIMLPPDLALIVPAAVTVTVTLFDMVILPTVVVANATVELLPKTVLVDATQAAVKGPVGLVLQFAFVQVALVPFVFQYN
jgi:hypothetical protein